MPLNKEKYIEKAKKIGAKTARLYNSSVSKIRDIAEICWRGINDFKNNELKDNAYLIIDKVKENALPFINYSLIVFLIFVSFNIYDHEYITITARISLMILILLNFYLEFKKYFEHGIKFNGLIPVIKKRLQKRKLKLAFIVAVNLFITILLFIKGWLPFAFAWMLILLMKVSEKKY